MSCWSKIGFSFCWLAVANSFHAQFYNLPAEYFLSLPTERVLAVKDSAIHTSAKPYIHFFSAKYRQATDSHRIFRFIVDDPGVDRVFYKHLINIQPRKENFSLRLDPLLNLEGGRDFSDTTTRRLYNNTRGMIGSCYIGDNFYFETMVAENQSFFPQYISNPASTSGVIPGQGRWKTFKVTGYDYAFSSGFFSVQAGRNLNLQAGHGKHKFGNGYRSLLMSDNAFNYPYARITQQWFRGRVQYTNIYAVLMNLVPASERRNPFTERLFQKKPAAFQQLSINLSRSFNIGFFQGIIWQAADKHNRPQLSWQYFNPIIYSNLITYGLNSYNNVLAGVDFRYKLTGRLSIYGHGMIDGTTDGSDLRRGTGYQAGFINHDALKLKGLTFQVEFNNVSSGSYQNTDSAGTDQSYSHYNQNLAFVPVWGQEFIFISAYNMKRVFINIKYNYQDNASFNNIISFRAGYLINPSYNFNISAGLTYRKQNFHNFKTLNHVTTYFFIALKTSLYNVYLDF